MSHVALLTDQSPLGLLLCPRVLLVSQRRVGVLGQRGLQREMIYLYRCSTAMQAIRFLLRPILNWGVRVYLHCQPGGWHAGVLFFVVCFFDLPLGGPGVLRSACWQP